MDFLNEHFRKFVKILPNLLSSLRIFIAIYILTFWKSIDNFAVLILIAMISDFFDGFIARKCNCSSNLGKVLDPIGDKLLMNILMWVLYKMNLVSIVFFYISIIRDIIIVIGAVIMFGKKIEFSHISPSFIGKYSTFIHMGVCFYSLFIGSINLYIWVFIAFMIIISLIEYAAKFIKIVNSNHFNQSNHFSKIGGKND
jgi:cardiolipin synthase (CMP-forming)